MIPYIDPRDSYEYMDKAEVMRELKMARDMLDWYTRQREVIRKLHERHLAKLRPQFLYNSLPECKRAWKDGKIDSYKYRQQLWRWDAIKREEQLRDDKLDYIDMMITNFQALKWYLEDMRDGKDTPRRPVYKAQHRKRKSTYRRPRVIHATPEKRDPNKPRTYKWHKIGVDNGNDNNGNISDSSDGPGADTGDKDKSGRQDLESPPDTHNADCGNSDNAR